MAIVTLFSSLSSYGTETDEKIFSNTGLRDQKGLDFGDIETGVDYPPRWLYMRHDGLDPIYNVSYYIRSIGTKWGGYVQTSPDSYVPYNPNWFRSGGVDPSTGLPTTATADYDFIRNAAYNNPEMGVRVHYDRNNPDIKSDGLGFENKGLNYSAIMLQKTSLDYSRSANPQTNGVIYPEPEDSSKTGRDGDEALVGMSVKLPSDVEGSGHIQVTVAFKYRFTI